MLVIATFDGYNLQPHASFRSKVLNIPRNVYRSLFVYHESIRYNDAKSA